MTGKTHITLGIASALLLTHPATVPGVIAAVAGGGLGGRIVDIDSTERKAGDRAKGRRILLDILLAGALIGLDASLGDGFCRYLLDHRGPGLWTGLLGLVLLVLIGTRTGHRTFTHSLLGMALFGVAVRAFCRPLTVPFLLGYGSHLLADLFTMRGLQIFFPLPQKVSWKLCAYDQRANRILFWVTLLLDIVVGGLLLAAALAGTGSGAAPIPAVWA